MHPFWNVRDQLGQGPEGFPSSLLPPAALGNGTNPAAPVALGLDALLFAQTSAAVKQLPAETAKDTHAGSSSSLSSSSNASGTTPPLKPTNTDVKLAAASKKERTRMIHKRFRQRKKERMNNMQQELSKIQAHVQALTDANGGLHAKSTVLTGLLQCIEDQSAFMLQYRQAAAPNPPPELHEMAAVVRRSMHMTVEDHLEGRRRYVAQVMPLLRAAEADPSGPAMAVIKECNDQQKLFSKVLCCLDPEPPHIQAAFLDAARLGCPVGSHMGNVHILGDPDTSDHQVWGQVVALLDLSEEQVRMCLAMRDLMVANLQKLTSEQQSLAALSDRLMASAATKATSTSATTSVDQLQPDDAVVALQLHRNMQRQKQAHIIMFWYLCDYVLDDIQYATLWVHAFPNIPFALSVLNVVAAEQVPAKLE